MCVWNETQTLCQISIVLGMVQLWKISGEESRHFEQRYWERDEEQ